jgi:hypothetical protein
MISGEGVVGDQGRAPNNEVRGGKVIESWFLARSLRLANMSMDQTSFFTPPVIIDVLWYHQFIGDKG